MKFNASLLLSLLTVSPLALGQEQKKFASCYGDHHGSYLKLSAVTKSGVVTSVSIAESGDADFPPVMFRVVEVSKNHQKLEPKAYSWAIRQAIVAESKNEFFGYVKVKAIGPKNEVMYLNLSKFTGPFRNAMSIDGDIQSLTCPADQVSE